MENILVKDLMVPISAYATVPIGTPMIEAMRVLEKAQEAYTKSKYQHRAILVLDENGVVAGKIGQLRVLRAVESEFGFDDDISELKAFHFSEQHIALMRDQSRIDSTVLSRESLQRIAQKKVETIMQQPTPGEYVDEDSHIEIAIHKLVSGTHVSLLVTKDDTITGVLRIADVFAAVYHELQTITGQQQT